MTLSQTLYAIDTLNNPIYAHIVEYIKSFNNNEGFMFTKETDPNRIAIKKQMEDLLDDGLHSGRSWSSMMRTIQDFYKGVCTYEELVIMKNKQEEWYKQILEEDEQNMSK